MTLGHYKNKRILFRLLLAGLDIAIVCALYSLLVFYRYNEAFESHFNANALAVIVCTILFTHYIAGAYRLESDILDFRFLGEYLIAAVLNLLLAQFFIYFLTDTPAARAVFGSTLIIFPIISLSYRYFIFQRTRKSMADRLLYVLGAGELAQDFYHNLIKFGWPQIPRFFDIEGTHVGKHLIPNDKKSPIVESAFLDELRKNIDNVDSVVVASKSEDVPASLIEWLISKHYLDVTVQTVNKFYANNWKLVNEESVSPFWAFEDGFLLNQSASFEHMKRVMDIVIALTLLVITSPLLLIIAILIRVNSSGPALFKQTRIGIRQTPFTMYKFRTMYIHEGGEQYTQKEDPRITAVGQFLRKTRVDELPQFINVLLGEMSVIGPRAEWDKLVTEYQRDIPYYHFRHLVKPGITGWAQVNYPYGSGYADAVEKLKYDLYYVRYYSFRLDLTICVKTICVMIFGKGQ